MAFVIADRVKETSVSTGTGALTLAGAMTGFQTFAAAMAVGDTCYYAIQGVDAGGAPSGEWECGLGTYSAAGVLTRTTVTSSSNAGAAVNLSAGTKQVMLTYTASQAVYKAGANVFTKNQSVAPSILTSGASIAVNAGLSNNFRLVIGVNATLANPTNLTDGMVLNFRIKQDATGSRTLAYGTAYKFPGGTPPALSTGANAVDFISCYYDGTDAVLACNISKGLA